MGKLLPHTAIGIVVGFVYMTLVVSTIVAAGCATMGYYDFEWQRILQALGVSSSMTMIQSAINLSLRVFAELYFIITCPRMKWEGYYGVSGVLPEDFLFVASLRRSVVRKSGIREG